MSAAFQKTPPWVRSVRLGLSSLRGALRQARGAQGQGWPWGRRCFSRPRPQAAQTAALCGQIGQMDAALRAWCQMLRLRDPETYAHSVRVAEWAVALGAALGLDETTLRHLRWAALLHDLGKVRIPNRILHKNGALNENEWQIMRQHPIWGYEIVRAVPGLPKETCQAVLHHHERWDGQGYPQGLAGKAIPLLARILGVVDTWDALTSQRPYRTPMAPREVKRYLQRQAGVALDPHIVAVFMQVLKGGQTHAATSRDRAASRRRTTPKRAPYPQPQRPPIYFGVIDPWPPGWDIQPQPRAPT